MISINLLPHREEKRRRRKAAFYTGMGLAAVSGAAVVVIWYTVLQQMVSSQQMRNNFLQAEISKLEVQIKDIATLRAEIDALKARQTAVENLQLDRNVPVHVLNELVRQTPEGMYFTAVKQDGQALSVSGIAQTNERVSEFLRNTGNSSAWLYRPELIEIKAAVSPQGSRDQRRLYEFSVRLNIKRTQDQATAAPGAASAASAAGTAAVNKG